MAAIPGIVYVIIGGVVLGTSLKIGQELLVFVYVGAIMLVWGVIKIVWKAIANKTSKKTHHQLHKHEEATHPHHAHPHPKTTHDHHHAHHQVKGTVYRKHGNYHCSSCGHQLQRGYHFCPHCGSKL